MNFKQLTLAGWRQFEFIDLDIHPVLTIITGANGAGKSSLLNIFSQHLGWNRNYLGTPKRNEKGIYEFLSGLFESVKRSFIWKQPGQAQVGSLTYSDGSISEILIPERSGIEYGISLNSQKTVIGIHFGSHQPIPHYQVVANIPTRALAPEEIFNNYTSELQQRYQGGHSGYSHFYRLKEALISMAVFGEGNKYVQKNFSAVQAYNGFVDKLKKALPDDLGFIGISIRTPDVVLETTTGEFPIDAASGGMMTLIDLVWRIYMFSLTNKNFVVTMDEPENHLHPSMQRSLLPKLIDAFPGVQFIVATHSPFVVSSVKESNVYVLRYSAISVSADSNSDSRYAQTFGRRVSSVKLDTVNRAGSANEILRDVLGVPATIPQWVEDNLRALVENYRDRPINSVTLQSLRSEMINLGYGDLYPEALSKIARDK